MKNKRLTTLLVIPLFLLLLPLIGMQVSDEVDWDLFDFIVMGILLFGTALTIEFILRKVSSTQKRLIFCGIVLLAFFVIWAELAVGIFGTPIAGS